MMRCESEKSVDVDATNQSNMVLQQGTFSVKRILSYLGSLEGGLIERREKEKGNAVMMHQKKQVQELCVYVCRLSS